MDVIARRAFERPDVEANRASGNPRQLGARLAHRAEWSLDDHMMLRLLVQAGALQNSQSPIDTAGAVMGPAWNLRDPRRWSILLTFEKLMYWSKLNQRGGR